MKALRQAGPLDSKDIAELTGRSVGSERRWLRRLEAEGFVTVDAGVWLLVEDAPLVEQLDKVAKEHGTFGRIDELDVKFKQERTGWLEFLNRERKQDSYSAEAGETPELLAARERDLLGMDDQSSHIDWDTGEIFDEVAA